MQIQLDFSEVVNEFKLIESQADVLAKGVLDAVTREVHRNWQNIARNTLHSTRNSYINSLVIIQEGRLKNVIMIHPSNKLALMVEDGAGPYDMKPFFERSKKVKLKKNGGWYLTIPMRWATPGSLGENTAFAGVMPDEVYAEAKKLISSKTYFMGLKTSGTKLTMPSSSAHSQPKTRDALFNSSTGQYFPAYTNKSPLFDGMQKQQKVYESKEQSQYNTFRRVSDKSDPNSWIHSGIIAHNLADKALTTTDIETTKYNAESDILSSLGF